MYCNKCGNELKEDDLFCNKCGNKIRNRKIKLIIIILGILVLIACIVAGIFFLTKPNNDNIDTNIENSTLVDLKKNANDKLEEYEKKYGVNYQEHTLESDDILTVVSREKVATYGEFINICEGYGEALIELKNYGYLGMENSFIVYLKVDKSKIDKIYNELASNPKVFKVIKGYLITYDSDSGKNNEGEILDFELKRKDY